MIRYPKRLIPKKKSVPYTDEFIKKGKLGRWHDPRDERTLGSIFDENGDIDVSKLDYKRFPGLSCNLIPPSKCKDLKIETNEELREEYIFGTDSFKVRPDDFSIIDHREVIELDINGLLSEDLPYKFKNEDYICRLNILHKPIKGNIAHCEIDLAPSHFTDNQKVQFRDQKGWRKTLVISLRRAFEIYGRECK